ncbi:Rne/Rng family ribonuclease [Kocuria tytonicola]|uniref:Ribonuclease E n=1 Tax=Kocuria tytonicola TaxID=2055946 RepID=A0A3L9L783_9MICC|nr:Rne/Rng family ribonuclease [Kocuria tytonicola]RLY94843.1 Rne/Rng family ribonuclease [Kocuria tytonicola]
MEPEQDNAAQSPLETDASASSPDATTPPPAAEEAPAAAPDAAQDATADAAPSAGEADNGEDSEVTEIDGTRAAIEIAAAVEAHEALAAPSTDDESGAEKSDAESSTAEESDASLPVTPGTDDGAGTDETDTNGTAAAAQAAGGEISDPGAAGTAGSDSGAATTTEDVENSSETPAEEPPAQEGFGAFGPGASLMFHAPDPEEIRRAAEAQAARLREAERTSHREDDDEDENGSASSKRRRRRRRGDEDMELVDDSDGSVTRVRAPRGASEGTGSDEVTGVKGSTRLEAKRQRRRESRQFGRRRHVITEAEFLARRESVERTMLVRQKEDRIQIGVLEDGILAEHFVSHTQQDSLIGNVYVGKVQNVLPSMEAAFVDIGRGRNAVLYAGEVDWDAAELGNKPRKIENALKSGDTVLVQVTKDPVGHKGARLTSQVSLPGRYLVYVPGGSMTGISRKLPDVERQRLKKILKDRLPEGAGVIVRTAAEGASETELTNDINRLRSQWEQIQDKARSTRTLAPEMLYAEPDLTIKTVRDVFNEDFTAMVVQGEQAWDNIEAYVTYVAPDLLDRLQRWTEDEDLFVHMRVEEQIQKALERKVFLPSGGSLVIDRTEAMTVVDVNTGKFTGSGGNLEETVTKNNLEAAEEIVRQLRLRDIGGIIVVDFIDMVLESNRDLVLRRLVECLGRDRTKHQVAEVTSLGLVQMTRKRMGTGLLEVFSEPCEECAGRGVLVHDHPLKGRNAPAPTDHRGGRNDRKRSRQKQGTPAQEKPRSGNRSQDSGEQNARDEATRTAFANIAAASSHEDDDAAQDGSGDGARSGGGDSAHQDGSEQHSGGRQGGEHAGDGESEGGRRRKKRRGKRSRGRAQNGEDNGSQDGSGSDTDTGSGQDAGEGDSSSLTIHGEVIELPQGQRPQKDRSRDSGSGRHGGTKTREQRETAEEAMTLDSLTAAFSGEDASQDTDGHTSGGRGATDTGSGTEGTRNRGSEGTDERSGRQRGRGRGRSRSQGGAASSSGGADEGTSSGHNAAAPRTTGVVGAAGAVTSGSDAGSGDAAASSAGRNGAGRGAAGNGSATASQPAAEQQTPARRRRGSRRAVAPAAAPGTASVQKHEYTPSERTAARFTAAASANPVAASDGRPTVVGVGVKAQDITMTPQGE